jgi:hypothetical protein
MIFPVCNSSFTADRSLSELANQISSELFGGVPFSGLEANIYDGIPAVTLQQTIMGLTVILSGSEGVYTLEFFPDRFPENHESTSHTVDWTSFIGWRLSLIPGVQPIEQIAIDQLAS